LHVTFGMNTSFLFAVGATHRTAPFEFRERIALGAEAESQFSGELSGIQGLIEFAVVSTCNRVEIYGVAAGEDVPSRVVSAFCARQRVDPSDFGRFGFTTAGLDAILHLMETASGLDSQILGETEILGQMKKAYLNAQERGSAGPVINRLFQKGFQAAKQARTHTAVSVGQVSVANLAVDLAAGVFGKLENIRVLLLGAGAIGEKSGKAFASRGVRDFAVCSRTLDTAGDLAAKLGAKVLPFEERESILAEWDVVVCSAAASGTVVSAGAVRAAMGRRGARPLLFVDLAMPRDVDPAAVGMGNVFLYNLDDLAELAAKNRRARAAEAERARQILAPRAASLWEQVQAQLGSRGAATQGSLHGPLQARRPPAAALALAAN
jgi:glutamyl-tRNA reductase